MPPNVMIEAGFVGEDAGTKRALVSFDVVVHVHVVFKGLPHVKPFPTNVAVVPDLIQVHTVYMSTQAAGRRK